MKRRTPLWHLYATAIRVAATAAPRVGNRRGDRRGARPVSSRPSPAIVVAMAKKDDPIFNIRLAGEVKKYPCIYDFKLSDYSRRDVTESAWENVATALNDEGKNYEYDKQQPRIYAIIIKYSVGRNEINIIALPILSGVFFFGFFWLTIG